LSASVAGVSTAIPAFIGFTERADRNGQSLDTVPTKISSLLEYKELFGGPEQEFTITISEEIKWDGASAVSDVITTTVVHTPESHKLYYNMKMFFDNGGGTCYIVSVGSYAVTISDTRLKAGIIATEKIDEITLLAAPDAVVLATDAEKKVVNDEMLKVAKKLGDRFAIIDATDGDATFRSGQVTLDSEAMKYGAAYYPKLRSAYKTELSDSFTCTYSVTDSPIEPELVGLVLPYETASPLNGADLSVVKTVDKGLYEEIVRLAKAVEQEIELAPSAAVAGVYARIDRDRGVWKAPANTGLYSVIKPSVKTTAQDQESYNIDPVAGLSINVIREFTGKGTLVWGARTLAGNDNEWRYIPVRRLYNYVEESVKKASEFVVFEPNTANTWVRTKGMIENFLSNLWKDGALAGATREDAFFVKIGLGETMTPQDILEGKMNVEIGMAAVRPAEFIVLKFSHKLQEA